MGTVLQDHYVDSVYDMDKLSNESDNEENFEQEGEAGTVRESGGEHDREKEEAREVTVEDSAGDRTARNIDTCDERFHDGNSVDKRY